MTEIDVGLFRGDMPDVEYLKKYISMRSILNLETQTQELIFNLDVNKEFRACQAYNIIYFDVAWSGIFPPKKIDIGSALGILKWGVRPLYFHCRAGKERTGFLAAVYRMQVQNWSFDEAFKEWKYMGCRFPTYWLWKKALKEWSIK